MNDRSSSIDVECIRTGQRRKDVVYANDNDLPHLHFTDYIMANKIFESKFSFCLSLIY